MICSQAMMWAVEFRWQVINIITCVEKKPSLKNDKSVGSAEPNANDKRERTNNISWIVSLEIVWIDEGLPKQQGCRSAKVVHHLHIEKVNADCRQNITWAPSHENSPYNESLHQTNWTCYVELINEQQPIVIDWSLGISNVIVLKDSGVGEGLWGVGDVIVAPPVEGQQDRPMRRPSQRSILLATGTQRLARLWENQLHTSTWRGSPLIFI